MNFDSIFNRIKSATKLKSQKELANFLGIAATQISKQKQKDGFPTDWAYKIAQEYNLSTDWILNGDKTENKAKDDFFLQLEKWGKETSGSDDIQWIKNQIDQTFPMFKEWRIRKEEEDSSDPNFPEEKIA